MLHARKSGFGLMEMILVLSIMAFIAYIIAPRVAGFLGSIKEGKTKLTLSKLHEGVSRYSFDVGHPPTSQEGRLNALINRPAGKAGAAWRGSYLMGEEEVPQDAWGNDFVYNAPPAKFKRLYKNFEIYSVGENEEQESNNLHVGA